MFSLLNMNEMSAEQMNSPMYLTFQRNRKKVQPFEADPYNKTTPMKRKNFSADEINLLKRLIQKYRPYQIENKKTDSVNLGEKQRIWENITAEFNSHFQLGEATSVKQLRKLWDNLKTRRKNELLRERLVDEENAMSESKCNMYDHRIKDEVNDSLDSIGMNIDYHTATNDGPYINGGTPHNNWTLPIETVIVEDDESYRDMAPDDDENDSQRETFPSSRLNHAEEKCQCNQSKAEAELREKKLKLILREEEVLYKMKKDEQQLKNEIASVQLRILKEKRTYLAKKRKLQLQILSKQLDSLDKKNANGEPISKSMNCILPPGEDVDTGIDSARIDSPEDMSNHI